VVVLEDLPSDATKVLGTTTSERINSMVVGFIEGTRQGRIGMAPEIREATRTLRDYLYSHVYTCEAIEREVTKAKRLLRDLYFHLLEHPTKDSAQGAPEESLERRTVDFIAGMTDQYALQLYQRLFFPVPWQV
jgi:dGTPase